MFERRDCDRLGARGARLVTRYPTVAQHRGDDDVAARARVFAVAVGRVARGALYHARDGRRFREREVLQLFAEEDARSLAHAAHGDGAAASEINLVTVEREDVLLRHAALDDGGERGLSELASKRALRREVCVLDELLRDGRAALFEFLLVIIPTEGCAREGAKVYRAVLEEAPVFGGEYRAAEHFGYVSVGERRALRGLLARVNRERLRLKSVRVEVRAVSLNGRDLAAPVELDADDLEALRRCDVARARRLNLDRLAFDFEATAPHAARLAFDVSGAAQDFGQGVGRESLARSQHARRGVDSGAARQVAGRQTLVNNLRVV